jgi:hypothetical protein
MNLDEYRDSASHRTTDWLAAMVEEAIAETVAPPRRVAEGAEPISAEQFLADAAAFLRARPDAAELLMRLRAMVDPDEGSPPERPEMGRPADAATAAVPPGDA